MTEKRQAPRQKSFLRGFVYFGTSSSAIDCLVRDISDTGARLKFSTPPALADVLELHIPIKGLRFRSKIQWIAGDEIGILFDLATATKVGKSSDNIDAADRFDRLEAEVALLKTLLKSLEDKFHKKIIAT